MKFFNYSEKAPTTAGEYLCVLDGHDGPYLDIVSFGNVTGTGGDFYMTTEDGPEILLNVMAWSERDIETKHVNEAEKVWALARRFCPDLPETYEDALVADRAGRVVELDSGKRGLMLRDGSVVSEDCIVLYDPVYTVTPKTIDLEKLFKEISEMDEPELPWLREADDWHPIPPLEAEDNSWHPIPPMEAEDNSWFNIPPIEAEQQQGSFQRRAVKDGLTGKRYDSIADWCKSEGLSKSSAYRLLTGRKASVAGHTLEYVS